MHYLAPTEHFSFNIWKPLTFDLISNFEFERDLNQSEFSNNNSGDVESLVEGYCSLIIRASHRPAAGATPDVMNVWQSKADDYSIVQCAMLYDLESGLQRRFECHGAYEMFQ